MSEAFDPYRKWLGIPPDEQPPNHYRLLGIALYEEDHDVIHHAADRQMAHLRTLQGGRFAEHSQKLLNEVSSARLCLLNPAQKGAYDEALRAKLAPPKAASPLPPTGPPPAPQPNSAPPPVPPPAVAPAVTAVPAGTLVEPTPLVRAPSRGRSASYANRRRKKSPLTMIVVILLVGGVGIAGLLLALMNGQQSDVVEGSGGPAAPKPPASPPMEPTDRRAAPGPRLAPRPPSVERPVTPPANGFESASAPLMTPPSVAEIEAQHLDKLLADVRMQLGQRELELAQRALTGVKAEALRLNKGAEYEHLSMLRYYLHQFWSEGVAAAVHRHMMPGDRFEFRGDSVELVSVDEITQQVKYKFNGTEATSGVRDIPTRPAIVFAWRSFERETIDPYAYIFTAAFLAFDSTSAIPEPERLAAAKKYWHEAAAAGAREKYVAQELGMTAAELGAGQPAEAATDPPQP